MTKFGQKLLAAAQEGIEIVKPKFGDAVNVPLSEMVVRGIGRVDLTEDALLAAMAEMQALTPEMIEAGFRVLSYQYDPDAPEPARRAVVQEMYMAMRRARNTTPKTPRRDPSAGQRRCNPTGHRRLTMAKAKKKVKAKKVARKKR